MKMADQDIPEFKRDELGKGVRGKFLKHFLQGSNVVVLPPKIQKAFPISEAVNKALGGRMRAAGCAAFARNSSCTCQTGRCAGSRGLGSTQRD